MTKPLFIKKIWQENNYTFSIQWNDNSMQYFRLSHVQRKCPCARCMDEMTGQSLIDPQKVPDDVRAVTIRSVGRYGIRIQFTSGCSTGIYSYDYLIKIGGIANQSEPADEEVLTGSHGLTEIIDNKVKG